MAKKFLTPIDLNKNEILNMRLQNLSAHPFSPVAGQSYFNTTDNVVYFYDGTGWTSPALTNGTVTEVTGVAPIASTGGLTPAISISDATTSASGAMSAADKVKLNGIATGANLYVHPNHTGDVTSVADGATTISDGAVGNAKLTDMAQNTIKGRASSGSGDPEDLTASQVRAILNVADGATNLVISSSTPQALGSASAGSSPNASASDHVHPTTGLMTTSHPANAITGISGTGTSTDVAHMDHNHNSTYLSLTGGTLTGNVIFTSGDLTLASDPTSPMHAVTKQYADAIAGGFDPKDSCNAATTTALVAASFTDNELTASSNGAISIDNASLALNDRLLVKDGVNVASAGVDGKYNGIYYVTQVGDGSNPWKIKRAVDFDGTPSGEVSNGARTLITAGDTYVSTVWALTTPNPLVVNTTALTFSQVDDMVSYSNGVGLDLTGTVFSVAFGTSGVTALAGSASVGSANTSARTDHVHPTTGLMTTSHPANVISGFSLSTPSAVDTNVGSAGSSNDVARADHRHAIGSHNHSDSANGGQITDAALSGSVSIAKGGTGASTAAGAKTNLGFMTRYTEDIGDTTTTSFTINHNLGTKDVMVNVYANASPFDEIGCDIRHTSTSAITIIFTTAPSTNEFRVVVIG